MVIEGKYFLFLIETICCDPSSELSRRDSSDERDHNMFLCRINIKYSLLSRALPLLNISKNLFG